MDSTSSAEVALLCAESTQTLLRAEFGLLAPLLDWRIIANLSWLFPYPSTNYPLTPTGTASGEKREHGGPSHTSENQAMPVLLWHIDANS